MTCGPQGMVPGKKKGKTLIQKNKQPQRQTFRVTHPGIAPFRCPKDKQKITKLKNESETTTNCEMTKLNDERRRTMKMHEAKGNRQNDNKPQRQGMQTNKNDNFNKNNLRPKQHIWEILGPETASINLCSKGPPCGRILIEIRPILIHFIDLTSGPSMLIFTGWGPPKNKKLDFLIWGPTSPF